jgi:hypothetical protein
MTGPMFADWENYYLMVGPSAAALIGLVFVVVTLTAGRDREQVERGKRLYTSPIVWHLAVVVVLSGCASAPTITARWFGAVSGGLGLLGIGIGIRNAIGIARVPISGEENNLFDVWWYGIVPALAYVGLTAAAVLVFVGNQWGPSAVAAALMGLLLVSIHAEWDLVTFLAPTAPGAGTNAPPENP